MASLNVFRDDAFSLTALTAAIQAIPYQPARIGQAGLFSEEGITSLDVFIEHYEGVLSLVPVASRGAAADPLVKGSRVARSFRVPHLPTRDTLLADAILGVRAFGSESEVETIAAVVAQRLAKMRRNLEYTIESHRAAALMGTFYDVTGAQKSLFTEFDVQQQTVAMVLGTADTKVRSKGLQVIEKVEDALGGLTFSGIRAFCGKTFWDKLISHGALAETVLNTQMAASLREDPRQQVEFGGITFERYRGTSAVKIPDAEAYAVPEGVQDLFITRYAPADYVETVNTLGQAIYAKQWEMEGGKGIVMEAQSNPLNICTRPRAVIKLTTN